jgi:hypothetical protein
MHVRVSRRVAILVATAAFAVMAPIGLVLASHQFTDVPNSNPFHGDIAAVANAGVTSGCGDGKFCPDRNVTRAEMAAFLNRLGALAANKTPVVNADKVDGLNSTDFGVAGVSVDDDGTVLSWFNKAGAEPTVTHPATGDYRVTIPGRSLSIYTNSVATVSVVGIEGYATVDSTGGTIHIRVFDETGALFNRNFNLLIFDADS